MRHIISLSLLLVLLACNSNENKAQNDTNFDCKDPDQAILNWRLDCEVALSMMGNSARNYKSWCTCMEKNYQVQVYAETDCHYPVMTFSRLVNKPNLQVTCGSNKDPL